ncbi:MAG: BNR repeat-containing protein [Patescibacteria group bacterium]|nr:BNR repeat-containing protein [Patescibacteria group bacterium]
MVKIKSKGVKNKNVQVFHIFTLVIFSVSLIVGVYLFKKGFYNLYYSEAGFNYERESYHSGRIGNVNFYRTNFATEQQSHYARSGDTPFGLYDSVSNKTYIVYGGGQYDGKTPMDYPAEQRRNPSAFPWYRGTITYDMTATDPYIVAYDHSLKRWEGPVRLGSMGDSKDMHNYPSIVMDNLGYIHVFYALHSGNDIYHFISERPRDISKWKIKTIADSPNSYVSPFVDNEGEIYIFFRSHPNYQCDLDKDGRWAEIDDDNWLSKCVLADTPEKAEEWCMFYEPQVYMKSSDRGNTWSPRKVLIDPGVPSRPRNVLNPDCRVIDHSSIEFPEGRPEHVNTTGYQTTYISSYSHDEITNRLWMGFVISRWHGAGGSAHQFTNPYLIFFDFSTDTIKSVSGQDLGKTVKRSEFLEKDLNNNQGLECCTIVKMRVPLNTPHQFKDPTNKFFRIFRPAELVIENQSSRIPTVFYNDWVTNRRPSEPEFYYDGISYVYRRTWNGKGWDEVRLDNVGDICALMNAEHRIGIGTFLYVKNFGGRPVNNLDYQCPTRIFSSINNYASGFRIFSAPNHSDWEVRGISSLVEVKNSHPDIRITFSVPKYSSIPVFPWMFLPQIGAKYVLGDNPLVRVSPTPTSMQCQPVQCNSWETVRIGDCSLNDWQKNPKPSKCTLVRSAVKAFPDIAFVKNSVSNATMMRYINVDPSVQCNTVSSDDPKWSIWEDYSDYKYWKLDSGDGNKKVCAQFKNICGQPSSVCGAMIYKVFTSNPSLSFEADSGSVDFSMFQSVNSQFMTKQPLNELNLFAD